MLLSTTIDVATTADELWVGGTPPNEYPIPIEPYSLREAIIAAHESSEDMVVIDLQPGTTYTITRDTVQWNGTFFGSTEGQLSDPLCGDFDISRDLVINGNNARIDANGLGRIFQIAGDVNVTIRNLDLYGGVAPQEGFSTTRLGGAIRISGGANVMLEDLNVHENLAQGVVARGGAVHLDNSGGVVTVDDGSYWANGALGVSADSNRGSAYGGAFYVNGGDLHFNDAWIFDNVARGATSDIQGQSGGHAYGGALYSTGNDDVSFANSLVENNLADAGDGFLDYGTGGDGGDAHGGAVYMSVSGTLEIDDSEFIGNRALAGNAIGSVNMNHGGDGGDAYGGAIEMARSGTSLDLYNTTFRENRAVGGEGSRAIETAGSGGAGRGGAIAVRSAIAPGVPLDIHINSREVLYEANEAVGSKGGVVTDGSAGRGGNAEGGAIFLAAGEADLTDSPFLDNLATAGTGGNSYEGAAGRGGDAGGGAIHGGDDSWLTFAGVLDADGAADDLETIVSSGFLKGNTAFGGNGGIKLETTDDSNDDAGNGGHARGGAIAAYGELLYMAWLAVIENSAFGGNGGHGNTYTEDAWGTNGGSNGSAWGGAIYSSAETALHDSTFSGNLAAGGRLDGEDEAAAFIAGHGGTNDVHEGLDGGNGGSAYGGAVFVTGTDDLTVERSGFSSNQAIGSSGGSGGRARRLEDDRGRWGGDGGRGGSAYGGAISSQTMGEILLTDSLFVGNTAIAGRGGSGGKGGRMANSHGADSSYGDGGHGGEGGDAFGGAISVLNLLAHLGERTQVQIRDTFVVANKVIAGDGGFGGNGGLSEADFGGNGGRGGDGGNAMGGGVHLSGVQAEIDRSTLEQNVVSSGWGAAGGYAGSGAIIGGHGGVDMNGENWLFDSGGDGSNAFGGGIALQSGSLVLSYSTVVDNHVFSGFGGNGGFGGVGGYGGGNGGNAGDGGNARGGGVYAHESNSDLEIVASTIARNRLVAGGAGFAGPGGVEHDDFNNSTPVRYRGYSLSGPLLSGASSVLRPESDSWGQPPGGIIFVNSDTSLLTDFDLGLEEVDATTLDLIGATSFAATVPVIYGGIVAGALTLPLIISSSQHAGAVAIVSTASTPVVATVHGVGAAITVMGGVTIGATVLSLGAIVLTKAITYGALTGDWEAAFAYALGDPGDVNGTNLAVLLQGGGYQPDDPPEPQGPGLNGRDGTDGVAKGTNIWGAGSMRRSLVAEGLAVERTRDRWNAMTGPGTSEPNTFYYDETVTTLSRPDVAGGSFTSDGTNLIGAADSGFTNDLHGTTSSPLDPRLADSTWFNGGTTPTIRLLPDSPARGALTIAGQDISQNGFAWENTADIGAWGGPENRPFEPNDDAFEVEYDGSVDFTIGDLLTNDIDPDGDPLRILDIGQPGNGTLTTIIVPGEDAYEFSNVWSYQPDVGFFGTDTATYQVTDGEFTYTVTLTFNVAPPSATVVGRHVFYNGSVFDGSSTAAGEADDDAIAPDKIALLPSEKASFANYTSYSRGINGIMIDIAHLPPGEELSAADFQFRLGNTSTTSSWSTAPAPVAITIRRGAGEAGSDRVTLIWANNAIRKQWLQVTVLPTANTGLAAADVFYFGNAVGETGTSATDAFVNASDLIGTRDNPRGLFNRAPIDFRYDFNRDGFVNASDVIIARDNQTGLFNSLRLIDLTASASTSSLTSSAMSLSTLSFNSASLISPDDEEEEEQGDEPMLELIEELE